MPIIQHSHSDIYSLPPKILEDYVVLNTNSYFLYLRRLTIKRDVSESRDRPVQSVSGDLHISYTALWASRIKLSDCACEYVKAMLLNYPMSHP
ncbi:hypothetical protein M514_06036 [Trichuris suis]|uniref:Uncharacterized protein n=1 Tax=Trichuris suis TaxID=68888 RepID=A0A085M7C6_9BILA|nr:hypothetical protein M513_06036 [Trichuris suis]KFD70734.1 hypothetical protein M514_06036 [Trichuris suis]